MSNLLKQLVNNIGLLEISVTLIIAFFVYLYTKNIHKKTLLNELDSKSEWRKKLFEVAGAESIKIGDIYTLRASVRFDCKYKPKTIFEKKTNEIINFCNCITSSHSDSSKKILYTEQEKTRIYCRYLLANHWEILQLTLLEKIKYKFKNGKWYKKEKELEKKTDQLITNLTP